jgi:hypothetical protein
MNLDEKHEPLTWVLLQCGRTFLSSAAFLYQQRYRRTNSVGLLVLILNPLNPKGQQFQAAQAMNYTLASIPVSWRSGGAAYQLKKYQ